MKGEVIREIERKDDKWVQMWYVACNFAFLFNCTPVGRTSDSMMVLT